jgi:DNA gyrase subunit B
MLEAQDEITLGKSTREAATGIAESQKYDAAQIDKLEGLEAVRKRPGMYIGDPDERGLHHCVFEVLDNSIDEHLAGYCSKIEVTVHVDGSVSIRDNGRGIPVDMHPKFKMPAVELVLTNLHAGGKFGQGAYKYSGGLHGVGAKCVNALSDWFKVEVSRDGKVYHMGFERGKTTQKLEVIGELKNKKQTGTLITFLPDATIFTITIEFKFERLAYRLRELAFLNPGLEITLTDERGESPKKETFFYKHGIEEFVRQLGENKTVIHPKPVILSRQRDEVFVDVVMQYNDSYNDQILCFANSIPNPDGGTHLTGFRSALTKAVNQYAKANSLIKDKDPAISGDDVREGLTCVLSIKLPNPRFESQTKVKLVNTEIDGIVNSVVYEGLMTFFDQNPPSRSASSRRCSPAARAREAARKARETIRKGALTAAACPASLPTVRSAIRISPSSTSSRATRPVAPQTGTRSPLPGHPADPRQAHQRRESAPRSGAQEHRDPVDDHRDRHRHRQAEGRRPREQQGGRHVRHQEAALRPHHHHDRRRRRRLAHPRALLTFFYRQMTELVRAGKIYIAQPPLYQIKRKKREEYVDDDVQLNKILISLGAEDVRLKNLSDGRELSAAQLKDVLDSLERLSKLSESVRRHGGDFETFLTARDPKTGKLPAYLVKVREGNEESVRYFHDEREVRSFHEANLDLNLFDVDMGQELLPLAPATPVAKPTGVRRRAKKVELHEATTIQKLIADLARRGLKVDHYAASDKPIFELIEGEGERAVTHPLFSIPEIHQKIVEIGRRGVQIKRFKGLGEMNAKELFNTTMDPNKRKLLQVDLSDGNAVEADQMFTRLMGDVVEPRRQYIEDNALNVRNLDV